jgi:DNA repair exonuclease SbcCD ATPase subunit
MNCKFLTNAYEGKEQINTLVAELNGLSNQLEAGKAELQKEEKWFDDQKKTLENNYSSTHSGYKKSLAAIDSHISKAEEELKKLKSSDWKKLLDESNEAENNNKILREKISSTNKLIDEAKQNFDNELRRIKNEISSLIEKIDNEIELKLQSAKDELNKKNDELKQTNQSLRTSRDLLESINRQLAAIDQQIEQVKQNDEKIGKLQEAKAKAETEIKEWSFLCKAFDKTGIPVLKLENSSIEITSITNQLLSFYDDQSRILFETTKLSKDKKKLIEDFGIIAIDAHNIPGISPTMDVNKKSGGEKVWYNTALQESICILKNQNKGKDDLTIFLDEQDGPLDSLGAVEKYFAMLSKVHELTKAYQTIIITHRQEILDFIPQQIKLRDGILEVVN